MAMNTSCVGEKIPLRLWLRISSNAVTQRKLDRRSIALPARYGNRALKVCIVR
jgi:hypothetical protein